MKKSVYFFATFLIFTFHLQAQEFPQPDPIKVSTLDRTIETLYSVISGEKGEARDWDLMRYLFHPDAKLIPSGKSKTGIYKAKFMSVEDYILSSGKFLVENGFFEKELHRTEQTFGNITQVFSTYESFHSEKETEPFMRGINSIQLLNDGQRWWIINIYWTQETEDNPIPKKYLQKN
jgi:hypothetical protein